MSIKVPSGAELNLPLSLDQKTPHVILSEPGIVASIAYKKTCSATWSMEIEYFKTVILTDVFSNSQPSTVFLFLIVFPSDLMKGPLHTVQP